MKCDVSTYFYILVEGSGCRWEGGVGILIRGAMNNIFHNDYCVL